MSDGGTPYPMGRPKIKPTGPPTGLAALRALVEGMARLRDTYAAGNYSYSASELFHYIPVAREELKWVEEFTESSRLAGVSTRCNSASDAQIIATLRARLARLEEALREQRRQMGYPGLDPAFAATMVRMIDAALARDGVRRGRGETE